MLDRHIPTEALRRLHLFTAEESELEEMVIHLEWCLDCNDRLEAIGRFVELVYAGKIRGESILADRN